jgi:4-amino-4-deoxy-L-arabinose transferase-like glycosyltransferase
MKFSFSMLQRVVSRVAKPRLAAIMLLGFLFVYWKYSLHLLDVFPPVHQDEQLIAAVAYKFATQGVLGSDLFAGYYAMERRLYDSMPVYALLEACVFKVAGFGPFQMRCLSVFFGSVVLILTFMVGWRLNGLPVGIVAAGLMITLRLARGVDLTGIPLLDSCRVNRYDMGVPAFGLLAFLCFLEKERLGKWGHFVAGIVIGLATMTHVYGAFWLPALLLVMAWNTTWGAALRRNIFLLVVGFVLACLPWLVYISLDWRDYLGQNLMVTDRVQLLSPNFYLHNLVHEIDRYRALNPTDSRRRLDLTRIGTAASAIGLAFALWRAWRYRARNWRAFSVALALIYQAFMFALLIRPKLFAYTIALWPLAVLLLAWVVVSLWRERTALSSRILLFTVSVAIVVEGGVRISHATQVARTTSPYKTLAVELSRHIPPHAVVLGLHHYWMGLHHLKFRSWLLPLLLSNPVHYKLERLNLYDALDRIHPDIVLIDVHMRKQFELISAGEQPYSTWLRDFRRYMTDRHAQLSATVNDPTYGSIEVFRLD